MNATRGFDIAMLVLFLVMTWLTIPELFSIAVSLSSVILCICAMFALAHHIGDIVVHLVAKLSTKKKDDDDDTPHGAVSV